MLRVAFLSLSLAVSAGVVFAQTPDADSQPQLPTVTTTGDISPEAVSDTNAQLIWLVAASPNTKDMAVEIAARREYRRAVFGTLKGRDLDKLVNVLMEFRTRYDAIVTEYNSIAGSLSDDDLWREYRDFRVKENDLVTETVRSLNDLFPNSASQFHTTIQDLKQHMSLSAYRSSRDPDYPSKPRTAMTGFVYLQGAVSNAPSPNSGNHSGNAGVYITGVIVGMVPGCPGKVYPEMMLGDRAEPRMQGPQQPPSDYVDFQATRIITGRTAGFASMISCAVTQQPPSASDDE